MWVSGRAKAPILFHFSKNVRWWLGSSHDGEGVWGREMHQQVQHNESSTLHTLTPPDDLTRGLAKAVKVALNEKYEIFPKKIGALSGTACQSWWSLGHWKPLGTAAHTRCAAGGAGRAGRREERGERSY